jgi:hypothetical protein
MPLHQPTLPIEQSSAGRLENGTSGRVVVTAASKLQDNSPALQKDFVCR